MKPTRMILCCVIALTFDLAVNPVCPAADTKAQDAMSLSDLSMEIAALQSLHRFEFTPAQMTLIRKLAAEAAPKGEKRKEGKGSGKVRKRMLDLRDALVIGNEARIEELEEQLADLLEEEETDIDDRVAITASAVRPATELLQSLTIAQVAAFLAKAADDVPEPAAALIGSLDVVVELKEPEWNDLAKEITDELKWQLGGLDPKRNSAIAEQAEQFLKRVRALNEKDLEKQRPELEKSARDLVARTPPTIVLHHFAERTLAELLSNPRLTAAVDALLEKEKEASKEKDKAK